MSIGEREHKHKITLGSPGNALVTLLAICLIIFVGFAFMKAIWYFRYPKEVAMSFYYKNFLSWFILPADPDQMMSQPWSILTHMFVHDKFWSVFTNMLWLWCFGFIMQDMTGNKKVIPVFIYGSLGGAMAYVLVYNIFPSLQPQLPVANTMGAAAGVMAIAVVTTMVSPQYRLFPMINGGIPIWIISIFYVVTSLATSFNDKGLLASNIAGAFTGFLFVFFLRLGYDWSEWMNNLFDWFSNLFNPNKPRKGKNIKEELFYKSDVTPYKKTSNLSQERIDAILDKINQHGYNFLTDEEKELLKRASQEEL